MVLGKKVAKNVKAIRLRQGISQQQLANKRVLRSGIYLDSQNTAPNVTLEVLERLSMGLECSAAELLGDGGPILVSKKIDRDARPDYQILQSLRSRI